LFAVFNDDSRDLLSNAVQQAARSMANQARGAKAQDLDSMVRRPMRRSVLTGYALALMIGSLLLSHSTPWYLEDGHFAFAAGHSRELAGCQWTTFVVVGGEEVHVHSKSRPD